MPLALLPEQIKHPLERTARWTDEGHLPLPPPPVCISLEHQHLNSPGQTGPSVRAARCLLLSMVSGPTAGGLSERLPPPRATPPLCRGVHFSERKCWGVGRGSHRRSPCRSHAHRLVLHSSREMGSRWYRSEKVGAGRAPVPRRAGGGHGPGSALSEG